MMAIPANARAMGARPSWMGYVWVEDVDAALPKLMAAGGKVFKAPSDIPGVGRFAVVADPYGGNFMLFRDSDGNPPPRQPPGAPGTVGWHELHADDGVKAFAFYCDFFGWNKDGEFNMGPIGVYHLFNTRHGEQGGIMTRMPRRQWRSGSIISTSMRSMRRRTGSRRRAAGSRTARRKCRAGSGWCRLSIRRARCSPSSRRSGEVLIFLTALHP